MSRKKKSKKTQEGLAGWYLTYADMMTLLFAFFVLLFSMSTLDPVKVAAFTESDDASMQGGKMDLNEIKNEIQDLIEELGIQDSARVSSDPRGVLLEIGGSHFTPGGTAMGQNLINTLDSLAKNVLSFPDDFRPIIIEGHTDAEPLPPELVKKWGSNMGLSAIRASVVVQYLISKGVNSGRLTAGGYADSWPFGLNWNQIKGGRVNREMIDAYNATKKSRWENRRINLIIGNSY